VRAVERAVVVSELAIRVILRITHHASVRDDRRAALRRGRFVVDALVVLAVLVFAPPVLAGDLNPPGPPAPMMKSLDQVMPTWDQKLPANDGPLVNGVPDPCNSSRFKCVLDNQAALDRETGLVWEKSPGPGLSAWPDSLYACANKFLGGRYGWRLPTIEELASLLDPFAFPALPSGHPFTNIQNNPYWSATVNHI
jgi:hypothetical protein